MSCESSQVNTFKMMSRFVKTFTPCSKVETQSYKSEGRGFDSRRGHWDFLVIQFFRPHYGPGVYSASKRNEYQDYVLGR